MTSTCTSRLHFASLILPAITKVLFLYTVHGEHIDASTTYYNANARTCGSPIRPQSQTILNQKKFRDRQQFMQFMAGPRRPYSRWPCLFDMRLIHCGCYVWCESDANRDEQIRWQRRAQNAARPTILFARLKGK